MDHDPTTCNICPEHPGEGWKISDVTHCPTCGATWRQGTNTNHCKKCHLTFATLRAGFDMHTDHGHQHPTEAGLVAQVNKWGTEEWGTQEGWDQRAMLAEKMRQENNS